MFVFILVLQVYVAFTMNKDIFNRISNTVENVYFHFTSNNLCFIY